jgi:hypothetical protein
MRKQPTRKIIVVVELGGQKVPVEFSQEEFAGVQKYARARHCNEAEICKESAMDAFLERWRVANIIKFPAQT